jgi:YbbR domain-containing protein
VQVTPDPALITIQGPVELVQAITFLPTQEIDLTNLRANQTRNVTLQLPSNVRATRDSVNVTLRIEPAQGSYGLAVAPTVANLGPGLRTTLQTTSVTVRVRGEVPTLKALGPGSVRATVDVGGLAEGVHVLDARVTVPQGVTLEAVEPAQVVVIISRE